jgi:RNA polymerase sigma-70 factor (family 1)
MEGNLLPDPESINLYPGKITVTTSEDNAGRFDSSSDELLIRRAFLSSPEEGCELLFRRYHGVLCSHALRYVYSREVAEDLVSDVFCKFWKNASFESVTTSYRFYLFRSVRNEAYSHLRAEFRKGDNQEHFTIPEAGPGLRPDHITQYEETFNRVKQLVEQLPPQCRKVFLLSRFEGKKYKEIAEEMGLSVKTVDTHLVKALKLMRSGLRDYVLLLIGTAITTLSKGWPL